MRKYTIIFEDADSDFPKETSVLADSWEYSGNMLIFRDERGRLVAGFPLANFQMFLPEDV